MPSSVVKDQDYNLTRRSLLELFSGTPQAALDHLFEQIEWLDVDEGHVLLAEGDEARELFVLCAGRVRIFVRNAEGRLASVVTVHKPGEVIGEQSFMTGRRFRNATAVTLTPVRVAKIPGKLFREHLDRDQEAKKRLAAEGVRKLEQRLKSVAEDLRELVQSKSAIPPVTRQLAAGECLFHAGDPSTCAYVVLSGSIALTRPGAHIAHEHVGAGLAIGSQEVLRGEKRSTTAHASERSEVMEVDRSILELRRNEGDGLSPLLHGLSSAIKIPYYGTAYRFLSSVNGESCVITDYCKQDGTRIRVRHMARSGFTEAVRDEFDESKRESLVSPDQRTMLIIAGSDHHLVGVSAGMNWPDLPKAMGLLLRKGSLTRVQADAFTASGELLIEDANVRITSGGEIVCACTNTTGLALKKAAAECKTVEELAKRTGAGTVCGGCRVAMAGFLASDEYALCRLSSEPLADGSICARLRVLPPSKLLPPEPGQHIRIEAIIDGRWVGRPYTLTGWSPDHYEVGVKIEENGFFSNWLLQSSSGVMVRVGAPEGLVCPIATDQRSLVYLVAGIGVTPAVAGMRHLCKARRMHVIYLYRDEKAAAYLSELRAAAGRGDIVLHEHPTAVQGRPAADQIRALIKPLGASEVVVCGPRSFNDQARDWLAGLPGVEVRLESFDHPQRGEGAAAMPKAWRIPDFKPKCPVEHHARLDVPRTSAEEARLFIEEYYASERAGEDPKPRVEEALEELNRLGVWRKNTEELSFAARLAWRNATRCVGRLHWQGLYLRDCRHLQTPDEIAGAIFDHLRFAYNQGDLRPAISIFDPGTKNRPGPRIWNLQLLLYAGVRLRSGKQIGDPARNDFTARVRQLGWEPDGTHFNLLPIVIETPEHGVKWYELPEDCRREVAISHPHHPWLANMKLRWPAIPAVSDMALDAGGVLYRLAPFNGWYLNTEIAARNFTDINRYNLLPEIGESMGFDVSNNRDLWRDKALIMINEAVIQSYDRAGVKLADHHNISYDFLEFCRAEQKAGREPMGDWTWLVPPVSPSTTALYQEPFKDISLKPAYVWQDPVWNKSGSKPH